MYAWFDHEYQTDPTFPAHYNMIYTCLNYYYRDLARPDTELPRNAKGSVTPIGLVCADSPVLYVGLTLVEVWSAPKGL